jgi:outer membrane protein
MKIVLVTLMSSILGVSGLSYAQTVAGKVGYVDLQRVIRDSQAGKSAKAAFEKEFQDKRRIIEQRTTDLNRMKQDFISKAPVMEEGARKQKAEELDKMEKDLNRTRDDFRDELQKRDFELTQRILSELESVVRQIGDSELYTLIVEKTEGGVIYATKGADLTEKVIQAYDVKKGSPGSSKK